MTGAVNQDVAAGSDDGGAQIIDEKPFTSSRASPETKIEDGKPDDKSSTTRASDKKLQRELELKQKEEERAKTKRENELKREELKKEKERKKQEEREERERQRLKEKDDKERKKLEEKEQKERKRLEEKEEKERKKLEEKLKKEEERLKKEEVKKLRDQEESKKKDKLKISNFFKPKSTVKSTAIAQQVKTDANDYETEFHKFFVREGVTLATAPRNASDSFDSGITAPSDLQQWFKSQPSVHDVPQQTAKYIYENQLSGAPIHVKFIKFYENVKSWTGTYTKDVKGLGLNPFRDTPPFIDFDDDVGEDEEGDGEDIDDEDDEEEEGEEEGDDEMGDFLEEDLTEQRRKILGPLTPVVHWGKESSTVRIEILKTDVRFPLDPLFDYWKPVEQEDTQPKKKQRSVITSREDLDKFASKVNDCDFTVPTMVEILKKELPNYTKATIENTLRSFATKVGPRQTEKKWQVDQELLDKSIVDV